MSDCPDIVSTLGGDSQLLGLVGSAERILQGRLSEKLSYSPPLILVDAHQNAPVVEGEAGILADRWACVIGILTEGTTEETRSRVTELMEGKGFRCGGSKRVAAGRPEWSGLELTFSGARMRR